MRQSERKYRRIQETVHDPYAEPGSPEEGSYCPDCGLEVLAGRWVRRREPPPRRIEHRCPACRRIADGYPAGELLLRGGFLGDHRTEVLNAVRNVERAETEEHPLHRVMEIEEIEDGCRITTTDLHLPHRIGRALQKAWDGELEQHYDKGGYFTRVTWRRD